jgi:tetratricopeptide (TPR) repeat protein
MFERSTYGAGKALALAQEEARILNHRYVGTEHILLGLLHEGEGVAAEALELLGISLETVRQEVEEIIGKGLQAPSGHIPFTPRAKKVIEFSLRETLELGHHHIDTEHILLGLIREGDGIAAQVLIKFGANPNRIRQQVIQLLQRRQKKDLAAGGGAVEPIVEERETRLAAVRGRLVQVAEARDLSPVLEPAALADARALTEMLGDSDFRARYLLGWLHWYRHQALSPGQLDWDLETSSEMFIPCFFSDGLPEPQLPLLANHATPLAALFHLSALKYADQPALLSNDIELWQRILASARADDPCLCTCLGNLGIALHTRAKRTGVQADLDAAIEAFRTALDIVPSGQPDHGTTLGNLGNALQTRFEMRGTQADLDAAMEALTQAAASIAPDDPGRGIFLSNLGNVLRLRFRAMGDQADLDAAIDTGRAAVAATHTDDLDRAIRLANLGNALRKRFESLGAQADLDAAIKALSEAVDLTPAGLSDRAGMLSNLGIALRVRFGRLGAEADLDAAIEALSEAADLTPATHFDRAANQNLLANTLRARFEHAGTPDDVDAAIKALKEAVRVTPAGRPGRAMYLSNLGIAFLVRFKRTGMQADIDAAIDALQESANVTPADRHYAGSLNNLGQALQSRFGLTGAQSDRDAAVSAFTRAAGINSAAPSWRIHAARAAASLTARTDPGRAANLLEHAVLLLPEVAPHRLERADQQHAISEFDGIAADAASLALSSPAIPARQRAATALGLLEAGRAVLLSQALQTRSDLTDLGALHPDLAARFINLRDLLDQPAETSPSAIASPASVNAASQSTPALDRHHLADDFAALLADIRRIEAFRSFALPPTPGDLLAQAGPGPVVTFNISTYRSDALLLTSSGITALELPGLARSALVGRINTFYQALHNTAHPDSREAQVRQTLEWLWDVAAGPVLHTLGYRQAPPDGTNWPRVWWIPGGLLSLLPIHAAGYHTSPTGPHQRTVMDRVISSYTPTISALRHARQRALASSSSPDRALIVAMPTTPGLRDTGRLPNVIREAALVQTHFPHPVLLIEPDPDDETAVADPAGRATFANVKAHLTTCQVAHFACHGFSDPVDPSQSLLLLHDYRETPFNIARLAPISLGHASLAYLSACNTAVTASTRLLDEAIHLTSAFQLAGFPHVIGTLWEIIDDVAVDIADTFYTQLRAGTGAIDTNRASCALHQATRAARDRMPNVASYWAAYLHAGA